MSLDVYLTQKDARISQGSGIFVRENGQVREVGRAEWDERFPDLEPVTLNSRDASDTVYSANITHNLNRMAAVAGVYKALWRPGEVGIEKARRLIKPLSAGLEQLKADPERFMMFNPVNGWGTHEDLVNFVQAYLRACEKYPNADVSVSR